LVLAKFYYTIYQAGCSKGTQMELNEGQVHYMNLKILNSWTKLAQN